MGPRELSLLHSLSFLLPSRYASSGVTAKSLGSQVGPWVSASLLLQLGLHLCLVGWLANGSAAHPAVFPAADCGDGQVGVVSLGTRKNLSERWDAYCYRVQGASILPRPALPLLPTYESLTCLPCRRGLPMSGRLCGRWYQRV